MEHLFVNTQEQVLRSLTFEFFGAGKHKILLEDLFTTKDAVFLDVRSTPEVGSVQLRLDQHLKVQTIPTDEIPDRIDEIPRDRTVGIFCSAGTRSAIVWAYLRSKGYKNVKVVPGGYEAVTSLILPGKLLKHIQNNENAKGREIQC